MNVLKIALLGTAALAAVSVSARADDLADLKAQIEALNGRISQLESSPSIPAGYQLLSVSEADAIIIPGYGVDKDFGSKATNIGILPTADVPASTNIQWSGYVKSGLVYTRHSDRDNIVSSGTQALDSKTLDVVAKAGLKVVGTTETAVGEVGVRVTLQTASAWTAGGHNGNGGTVTDDGYWGWWAMTPELTLGGGAQGSLAGNDSGFDGKEGIEFFGDGSGGYNHNGKDPAQIRLSYASGPLAFAIALEDENNTATNSALGVAGEMKYSGDTIGFELNAGYWDNAISANDSNWTLNAGANIGLGDIATLSIAAGVGEDANISGNADRYAKVSAWTNFTLSDAVSAQMGASYKDVKAVAGVRGDIFSFGAGIYYSPVSQLKLGLEGIYTREKGIDKDVGFGGVAVYTF
jgi:hypothetical protein